MLKKSKTQASLLAILALMMGSQLGFVAYQNLENSPSEEQIVEVSPIAQVTPPKVRTSPRLQEEHVHVENVKELNHVFDKRGYTLASAKTNGTVPRIYLSKLPKDMKRKKRASNKEFVQVLLPHILQENERVLADRERLLEMQKRLNEGGHLRHSEKNWLRELAAEYRCKSPKVETLLVHVDIVPPSLALAQATLETGGGRSKAALEKNSTFGHMQTKTKVARFDSLQANVAAYIKNLNRHAAYKEFRSKRAKMRTTNNPLCGKTLATGLKKYSIRGDAYIRDVQKMIHSLDLVSYDRMSLEQGLRLKP